jgi:DNA-binding NtrC family response regulator
MATAIATLRKKHEGKILIASSRDSFRAKVLKSLDSRPEQAAEAAGGAEALMKLEGNEYGTLLVDPEIEDLDVQELVQTIRARFPEVEVTVLDSQDRDVQLSFNLSAASEAEEEASAVDEAITVDSFEAGRRGVTGAIEGLPGMIGAGRKMQQIYRLSRLVAPRDTAVLIVGATGTGKELVARGIHALSARSRGPFVVVNCAAIPESLLEAELFGFTRGAFTGAFQSRLGRIHAAHGGTLLLDEVGELPLSMQAKLLRFVQEGEVQRLGSTDLFRVDTRLIAATNADLMQRVREKQFREDLYYRLAVFPLELPPLRNRTEDILPLAEHFLRMLCQQAGMPAKRFSEEAAAALRRHAWPGNVRELQHWVERAFVLSEGNSEIRAEDLTFESDGA